MKISQFYTTISLATVLIFVAVFYSNSKGYLNQPVLVFIAVGLLTFVGVFYSFLWSHGFERLSNLEQVLDTKKSQKIRDAVSRYNRSRDNGSEIFSDLSNELKDYEFVEKRLDINKYLLLNVVTYILTLLLFMLLPAEFFWITLIFFSIGVTLTITIITTLFLISDFEKRGDIEE